MFENEVTLHQRMQQVLDAHKPARRSNGILVATEAGDGRQTTCLCGHWQSGSYDDHVLRAMRAEWGL